MKDRKRTYGTKNSQTQQINEARKNYETQWVASSWPLSLGTNQNFDFEKLQTLQTWTSNKETIAL